MEFRLETEVGRDVTFADLLGEFDAVFLGVGTYKYMKGGFENESAPGFTTPRPTLISNANRFAGFEKACRLYRLRRQAGGGAGGGDTAMDCVRTAIRQGPIG